MMPTPKPEVLDTYRHSFRRVAEEARREMKEDSEACVDQRNLPGPEMIAQGWREGYVLP
jgi:hypothetical protein